MVLGLLALTSLVPADEPKKDAPNPPDKQVVDSKLVHKPAAASVNFRKELKLPFASLTTLGARIDQARRAPDPVALAHAASELGVAEKVSGKTASITSKQVLQEAAELASLRRQAAELKAVLQVANQNMFEEERIRAMQKEIKLAEDQTKAEQQAFQQNQEPTATPRTVVVNNYTTQYLDIWVNGNYKTQVQPGASQVITIEHRWNPTILTAYGNEDMDNPGPRYIWGQFTKYTWNIN
jgi:hypothetical protein